MTVRRELAELSDTCLSVTYDPTRPGEYEYADGALILRLDCMDWLQKAGYPIDGFEDLHTGVSVKSDDSDDGYLVGRLETLSKPTERADAVEDRTEFWACSCPDFHYRKFPDLEDGESVESVGACAHIDLVRGSVDSRSVGGVPADD